MAEDLRKLVQIGVSKGYSLEKMRNDFANAGWSEAYLNSIPSYYNEFKKKSPAGTGLKADGASPSRQTVTPSSSGFASQETKNIPLEDPLLTKKDGYAKSLMEQLNLAAKDKNNRNKYIPTINKLWNEYSSIDRGAPAPSSIFEDNGAISKNSLNLLKESSARNAERMKREAIAIAKDDGVLETAARSFYSGILGAVNYLGDLIDPDSYDDVTDAKTDLEKEAEAQSTRAQKASYGRKLLDGYTDKQIEDGFFKNFADGNVSTALGLFGRDLLEVLPQNAVGFIPYVGLPLMAASAGGQGWLAVKDDEKYNTLEKFLYAPLVGTAEYVTEKFLGMDRKMVQEGLSKAFGKTITSAADIPKKELGDMIFGTLPKAARAPLEEGLEEGLVSTFTQTLDKIMAEKPFDPVEIAESVMLGAGAGGSTYALVRGSSALLQTPLFSDVYKITNTASKIENILKSEDISDEERVILTDQLNGYKTQMRKLQDGASDYYKQFSQEDKQKTLELNQTISRGIRSYSTMKTAEAKAETVNRIKQSLAEKAQIEQKYDSTQKQQVPSPVVQGAEPGGVSVQGTGTETPQAGGVLQVPSQQEEKVVEAAKQPNVGFRPTKAKLTSQTLPQVLSGLKSYVESIPEETLKKFETTRQAITNGFEAVANVISSFAKEGLNVEIEAINTEDEWNKATMDPTTGKPEKLSRGLYYQRGQEGAPSKIILFAPALLGNTVYHEGIHEIVPQAFGQEGINKVAKALASGIKRDPGLNAKFGNFLSQYEEGDKSEELLAELGSMVAAGDIDIEITKSLATRFMEAVASVLGAVGIKMAPNSSQLSEALLSYAQKLGAGAKLDIQKTAETKEEGDKKGPKKQAVTLRTKEESLAEFGFPVGDKVTNIRQVGAALEKRQQKKYIKIAKNDTSDKAKDIISNYMVDEVIFELESLGESSAKGWYGEKFQKALDLLSESIPSLKDKGNRNLFTMLVAITSDGQKVINNFTYAISLYNSYLKDGVVSDKFDFGGDRNSGMKINVGNINRLIKDYDNDLAKINDFLLQTDSYGNIKKKYDIKKSDYKVTTTMPISAGVFGPKLGAFFANLSGQENYLTMDRWWSRTFNRYRGILLPTVSEQGKQKFLNAIGKPNISNNAFLKEVKKYADLYIKKKYKNGTAIEKMANTIYKAAFVELNDTPFNAGDRDMMIETTQVAQEKLKKAGYDLSMADIQAILWYFEKRLYAEIQGKKSAMDVDYSNAVTKLIEGKKDLSFLPNEVSNIANVKESEDEYVDAISSPSSNIIQLDEAVDLAAVDNATETMNEAQKRKPPKRQGLESYNEKDKPLPGQRLFNEPLKEASKIADDYYKKEFGEERPKFEGVKSVNKERAKLISDAYIAMKDNYKDPMVKKAYDAMIKETLKQFDFIIDKGYSVIINNNEPYDNSEEMIKDLRDNKQMRIFSTESGFGDDPITEKQRENNPLLKDSGRKDAAGIPLLNNDLFRFVHDFFGHADLGNGFGAIGEENAWNVHSRMYSPIARRAMTTETRGQNSYVNFSGVNEDVFKIRDKAREERKKGNIEEANRLKKQVDEKMKFADQKVGLLPEWVSKTDEDIAKEDIPIIEITEKLGDYDLTSNFQKPKAQRIPQKTQTAYKLFRVKKSEPGKLFPLYVLSDKEVPVGEWIEASMGGMVKDTKGNVKVKSSLGPLAMRPGWHSGDAPFSTHIGKKVDKNDKSPSFRADNTVWAEVEVGADVDWQQEANARAEYTKDGKLISKTAHITDQIPALGFYKYKTNSNMTGNWLISGEMKVNRILTDEQVAEINEKAGFEDLPRLEPMDWKAYGFEISDGDVKPTSKGPKPKRQDISKAQGPLIPVVYNSLLQQSTRNADGTNTPPYTLQEWLTMMTPYLNAQTATAIYNGVVRNKPPFTAPSIQDAYDSSKKRMEAGKNKAFFTWNNLKKYFIDRQAELKKAILASGMKNAYNYLVNKAGSGARAAYFYYEKEKDIYKDLKKEQIEKLDQIIMLRRIIEIDSNFDERDETRPKHTNGFNKEYAEMELARLQKELGNAAYNDLNNRATKYFDAFRSLLDSMYEEGLVSEELYEQLKNIDYQPRLFLDHVFEMDEPSMREMNLSAAQIKRIKEGSEGDIMFDSRFLLALYAKSAFSKIARNKANKEIAKATEVQGNESWVSKTDKPGFSEVTYFEDGVRKSFYLKDTLKSELDDISRVSSIPQNIQKLIGMVTGSFAVKLLATRANPLFVAKNVPRDYLHVLFFTKAYDNMSLPLAAMRLAGDFIRGVKSKLQDDQDFKDFVEFGGGMDFLSTEGMESMITNRTVTNKIIEKLGKAGELSEIGFRLAMYKKFKEDGMKALGPNATEDEVTRVKVQAVTQAREMIDFSQGGIATKNLEIVSPYINSAFQGFRVSTSYIQNNPKEFAVKLGYLSIGVLMLALYNAMVGDDDMEDIPEETKRKYFIIMTPFAFEEDGKTKRHYIKIAKTQQLAPFIAGLELTSDYFVAGVMGRKPRESKDAYEYAWKGATMYFPKDPSNIKKEISSSVPLFAAIAAYDMNYDTYRERAVSMDYNQVLPQDEDFTNKQVPYFYKALAQGIGASGGEAGPKRLQVATEKFVTTPYSSLLTMGAYTILDSFSRLFELKGPGGIPVKDQAAISNSVSKSLGISMSKVFTGATEPDWRSYTRKEEIERINMEEKSERRGIKIAAQNIGQKYFEAYNAKDSKAMSEARSEYQDELMRIRKESGVPDARYFMDAFQQARKYGKATNPEYNDISYAANNEAKARIIMEYGGRTMSRKELVEYINDYKRKTGKPINGSEVLREYQKETGYGK